MLVSDRDRYAALVKTPPLSTATATPSTSTPTQAVTQSTSTPLSLLAPLPKATLPTSAQKKQTEQRELLAHAKGLGVVVDGAVSVDAIVAAELGAAQKLDPRVTSADMARAKDRARRAKDLVPVRQQVLSGFTRVVDAKLQLTPALVAALAADIGKDAVDLLLNAIDKGPGNGAIAFSPPAGKVELVASIVRQLVLGQGASLQLPIAAEHAAWIEGLASSSGSPVKLAMGGAGAFAANLMSALPGVRPRFFSKDTLPEKIAERFADRVEVVDGAGAIGPALKHKDNTPARVNFACEYNAGETLSVAGRTSLKVNGKTVALTTSGAGRVILGTKAKDVAPGFDGVDDAVLQKLGREHDLFFFVGSHYLTQHAPAVAKAQAAELGRALDVMKAANPKLVRHLQYVVPKVAAHEAAVLGALKGHVESLSMNAVEVPMLVDRLHSAGLCRTDQDPNLPREQAEEPASMLAGALGVKEGLGLNRVHLHGLYGDLVVVDDANVDVERTRLALLRARQLASMKAANASGEIKGKDDLFDVVPVVQGRCLAAVQRFADAVQARFGLSDDARAAVARDWVYVDADQRAFFFVPSRGIHDRTGGTVSLGDTIDASALVFSKPDPRPPTLPQLMK
jgi:ADP-dependent phosphofructokinase/glucokinase